MATIAPYDSPGVYDQIYQVKENMANVQDSIRFLGTRAAKLRGIDAMIAQLTARRGRVDAGTETDTELYGPEGRTVLATGPVTTLPITRPL